MKNTWKMLEATNKNEAIISILDALNQNETWLNKCNSSNFISLYNMHTRIKRENFLKMLSFDEVRDLFIEIKKEYYENLDFIKAKLF
jgi:hypothetical protein